MKTTSKNAPNLSERDKNVISSHQEQKVTITGLKWALKIGDIVNKKYRVFQIGQRRVKTTDGEKTKSIYYEKLGKPHIETIERSGVLIYVRKQQNRRAKRK